MSDKDILEQFAGSFRSDGNGIIPSGTARYFPGEDVGMRYAVGEDEAGPYLHITVTDNEAQFPEWRKMAEAKYRVVDGVVKATGIRLSDEPLSSDVAHDTLFLDDPDQNGGRAVTHLVQFRTRASGDRLVFGAWKCPPD